MSLVTRRSLLDKVRDPGNEDAWKRFYAFYAPLVVGFAMHKGCPRAMADDVLQEAMVAMLRTMPTFVYDPTKGRFRSFLLKIVHRLVIRAWKREDRYRGLEHESRPGWANNIPDWRAERFGEGWDDLFEQRVLAAALERVRKRVSPHVYRSFEVSVLQAVPVPEVMARLGIDSANAVHQHRNRVIRYLREEAAKVRQEMGE